MRKEQAFIQKAIEESLKLTRSFFDQSSNEILRFYDLLREARQQRKQVFLFGNGGSAADAQHFAAELVHRVESKPIGIRAHALHCDTSLTTALANDEGFERIFSQQILVLADSKDLVVGISTGGDSANVVEAFRAAKNKGCRTVGLLGRKGGKSAELCDLAIIVPHSSTPRIQEVHGVIIHVVCQLLELDAESS